MLEDLFLKNLCVFVLIYTIVWSLLINYIHIYVVHFICILLQLIYLMLSLFRLYVKIVSWKVLYD
jgi:hypothetical protein